MIRISPPHSAELNAAIEAHQAKVVIGLLTNTRLVDNTPLWASLNKIGERFFKEGYFTESLTMFLKAYKVVQVIKNNDSHLILTIRNLAQCYFQLQEYVIARTYFRLEMDHEEEAFKKGKILLDIGVCYFNQNLYVKALETYKVAHALFVPSIEDHLSETATALNGMGCCQSCLGHYQQALDLFLEALSLMSIFAPKNHECMIESSAAISECHKNLGNLYKAKEYWDQTYQLAKSMYGEADPITQKYKESEYKTT